MISDKAGWKSRQEIIVLFDISCLVKYLFLCWEAVQTAGDTGRPQFDFMNYPVGGEIMPHIL